MSTTTGEISGTREETPQELRVISLGYGGGNGMMPREGDTYDAEITWMYHKRLNGYAAIEGQTEETFVKEILADHLSRYHIFPYATRVCTKRVSNCRRHRGGVDSYSKIKTDIQLLRRDSNITAITTMFDFYAFPTDAPGYASLPNGNGYVQV